MRVSIIREDNIVVVDGVSAVVDCSELSPLIQAIQWIDDRGWIEFTQSFSGPYIQNINIVDFTPYLYLVDRLQLWQAEKRVAATEAELTEAERAIAFRKHEEEQMASKLLIAEQTLAREASEQQKRKEIDERLVALEKQQTELQSRLDAAQKELEKRNA